MIQAPNTKRAQLVFALTLVFVVLVFFGAVAKTTAYNAKVHQIELSGAALLGTEEGNNSDAGVSVLMSTRPDTWTKIIDLENTGLTEPNFRANIYDVSVSNGTADEVSNFSFKLTFHQDAYIASGWNGAVEVHQGGAENELVDTIPDLRTYAPEDVDVESIDIDGEACVVIAPEDWFRYLPSTSANAVEVPIKPHEGTTPGFIIYVPVDEELNATLEMQFSFHRLLTGEPLFWLSLIGLVTWGVSLAVFSITSAQIHKYQRRHERDMEIINESIETFTGFIDAKDPYTHGHSKRVAHYTRLIAQELGYEGEELERIYYTALLHDCGKIGVPDNILGKPGRLTDEEFEIIKSHTTRGGEILSSFKSLENVGEGALYHHERYDGKGYPQGLAGEDIPYIARMICVADSFDAMNSNRVYRRKLTREQIIDEIESNRGLQFDPEIADVMLRLIRSGAITI